MFCRGFGWEDDDAVFEMRNVIVSLVKANLHVSDMRGRVKRMTILDPENLDVMKILEVQKIGPRFLTGQRKPSETVVPKEENWMVECRVPGCECGCESEYECVCDYDERSFVMSIVIPNYIEEIGYVFMRDAYELRTIDIPDSVTYIGDDFLNRCRRLRSIQIPSSVVHIGSHFMYGCESLETVIIDASIKTISDNFLGYEGCENLRHVEVSDTVTVIGEHFLSGAGKLREFELPSSLVSIGPYFMSGCPEIESVSVPESVRDIDEYFMAWCTGLRRVELSGPVKLSYGFLRECASLNEVSLAGFGTDVEIIKEDGTIKRYPRGTILTKAAFPSKKDSFCHSIEVLFGYAEVRSV